MPFRYSPTSAIEPRARLGQALLGLLCWAAFAGSGAADSTHCALVAPQYQAQGDKVSFEITLDCAASSATRPIPLGVDLLVGLTVYDASGADEAPFSGEAGRTLLAAPDIAGALGENTRSQAVRVAGEPKWIVLTDAGYDSFDFSAKTIRIEHNGERLTVRFQADENDLAGKDHFLFAVWPASARRACDQTSLYSRSGCRRDGYVIGDDAGVEPLVAYPGLEINQRAFADVTWNVERWIVERFR